MAIIGIELKWVEQWHLHHTPVITIFLGGMLTIPKLRLFLIGF